MSLYTNDPSARNRASATLRLPNPDPLTMDFAARRIATRYNVSPGLAAIVAELIASSLGDRR